MQRRSNVPKFCSYPWIDFMEAANHASEALSDGIPHT